MMNSGLRRLLSGAVALMLLGCSSALADTATVTARKLILREKASSTSDALQTLPKGTKLEVLGKSGSWYKVTYGKYTGYVYKTYVSVTKTASSSSSSSSTTRLEKGSTGSDVKDLQTKLKKLGYYDAYVDGDYGDTTVAAVKAFQKKYNLTADGIAGKETLKKLDSAYENVNSAKDDDSLRMGDSGSAVKDLQTKLKKLGYYDGTVDSTFGSGTYAAVKAFQKKYNLTADGVAGSETLKKLDSAYKNADSDKDDGSLRKGATGSAVKNLQTKLKKLGFYNAYVDGSYGDTTVAAVKAFQKKYNLTANHADWQFTVLILLCTDISTSLGNGKLHIETAIFSAAKCCNYLVRIHNFNILINLNVCSGNNTFALMLDISNLWLVCLAVVLDFKTLHIHDDLCNIFFHSRDRGELVKHALNLNLTDSCTRKRRQHDSS